jgi:hypothetical protein
MSTVEISFAQIYRQVGELRSTGRTFTEAEVGPLTWEAILLAARSPKWGQEGWVMGVHVFVGNVPEGKLWPLESVK